MIALGQGEGSWSARGKDRGAEEGRDGEMLWRRHHQKGKLFEKQKAGKARMREYGSVSTPQEAVIAALRMGEE